MFDFIDPKAKALADIINKNINMLSDASYVTVWSNGKPMIEGRSNIPNTNPIRLDPVIVLQVIESSNYIRDCPEKETLFKMLTKAVNNSMN